jgi:SAM-dependent methyltransferase
MFNGNYALLYDSFHESKDYLTEINKIVEVLELNNFSEKQGFDFGCGTGLHAHAFLEIGIEIDGFDRSEEMLSIARKRNPELMFSSNIKNFEKKYDFTYSLFDVLSYQVTEEEALNLFHELFSRTKSGGYALVDSWNSDGVFRDPPKLTKRTVESHLGFVTRKVIPDLSHSKQHIYPLQIDLIHEESNEILISEFHVLRAWSPNEVDNLMSKVGFKDIFIMNFENPSKTFKDQDWRFAARAKKP